MKIAGVSMTYNDGYKLKEWKCHYDEYKGELDYYIVVDNGSSREYMETLASTFEEAIIIKRKTNGGCTAAYNDGIKYILKNTDADAVVIIANDFKLKKGCLRKMYEYLYSDEQLGVVSTAVLFRDSMEVDNYGHIIDKYKVIECDRGKNISELAPKRKYTDLVTGGFYMAKKSFYDDVGLQDENLFMYGDEFDTSIRMQRAGYRAGVTCETYAWHWHINEPSVIVRKPAANYLIARNRIYVSRKHFGKKMIVGSFWYFSLLQTIKFFVAGIRQHDKSKRLDRFEKAKYCLLGGIKGIQGDMRLNKYTKF